MIRPQEGSPWGEALSPAHAPARVRGPAAPERLAFATLWATGHDPGRDGLFRVMALRRTEGGRWEGFGTSCRPEHAGATDEHASARMVREFGTHASDVAESCAPGSALADLHGFLGGRSVIVPAREPFLAWWRAREGAPGVQVLALTEVAGLCLPGRLAAEGEALAAQLLGRAPRGGPRALEPGHLRAALGVLVARVLAQSEPARAVLFHALSAAARALEREGGDGARDVELVLALLEHPTSWRDPERALEPEAYDLRDGRLGAAVRELPSLSAALDAARPRWSRRGAEAPAGDPPAARLAEERTLDADDRRVLDEIFEAHLPRHFAAPAEARGVPSYRPGQHGVARVIAEGFGRRELRLVHAPTGTGKTLAYLVPVALWALRNHARVGVATFTRVLQEQAMQRETPLALELLRSACGARGIRVTVLKGRENYLCWRALCLQARAGDDLADEALAWSQLASFALRDEDGDLDRFSVRVPLGSLDAERYRRAAERLLRAVRSQSGCCPFSADRATCAAEAAWRAAERAHVVITNHALALARRDFFAHLVFDECEHMHDVALNAFSSSVSLREIADLLGRLHGDERRPLDRVAALAPHGSDARAQAEACLAAAARAREALAALGQQCRAFEGWRAGRARERLDADHHSLFREYVLEHGQALQAAHAAASAALGELAAGLARLQETLEGVVPGRELARLRRALEILRVDLDEQRTAVEAWIPRDEGGRPAFGRQAFHDLETTAAGDDVLATRVLLPHEYLGRHYYPTLAGAVLLSATTWLRGGFEAAEAYLGLARAREPAPDEAREPFPVRSFRAPEAFDYSRVLVAVPRDAPAVHEKQAFLDYTARFVAFLAERTRGRLLALFTNAEDLAAVGTRLEPFFAARRIPFWWQRMRGVAKEELGQLFRAEVDSVLLGLDTFWYGADFPGSTLEYLVIVRLPYGVPDRYHHAQCAALGASEQRRTIYLPHALAKFRQGFGRLMRKESDRGCVFVLDKRVLDPRHRLFLAELPVANAWEREAGSEEELERLAHVVLGDTDRCVEAALAHMDMKADVRRRGLERAFAGWTGVTP